MDKLKLELHKMIMLHGLERGISTFFEEYVIGFGATYLISHQMLMLHNNPEVLENLAKKNIKGKLLDELDNVGVYTVENNANNLLGRIHRFEILALNINKVNQ